MRTTVSIYSSLMVLVLTLATGMSGQTVVPEQAPLRTVDTSRFPNRSKIKTATENLLGKQGGKVTDGLNLIRSTPKGVKLYAKVHKQRVIDFVITYPVTTDQPKGGGTPELDCNSVRRQLWSLLHDAVAAANSGDPEKIKRAEDALTTALEAIEWCNSHGL